MTELTKSIDRLAVIKNSISLLEAEKDKLEAEIIKSCEADLENTKYKSIHYSGTDSELTAVNSESLKVTYNAFLPFIFGKAYNDAVTEKKTYTLSAAAKRMIIGIWKGNYIRSTVRDVIDQMKIDEVERKQLVKKCKGLNYDKDVANILKFTKLSTDDAREYAYLMNEAAVWQEFMNLMNLNDIVDENEIDDIISRIQAAVVVEDSTKISLTSSRDHA